MTAAHPPLTAEDFNTQYYAEHRYIFIDDEDANMLYTYGHDRDEEFARQANEFDIEILGLDVVEAQHTAADIHHFWAITIEPKPQWRFTSRNTETHKNIEENTPGAFPVSVIFR